MTTWELIDVADKAQARLELLEATIEEAEYTGDDRRREAAMTRLHAHRVLARTKAKAVRRRRAELVEQASAHHGRLQRAADMQAWERWGQAWEDTCDEIAAVDAWLDADALVQA